MKNIKKLLVSLFALPFFIESAFLIPNTEICYSVSQTNSSGLKITLSEQELKKFELNGQHKKDWAQRLQWFESKIISYYKNLKSENILVVGDEKFLEQFKLSVQKENWEANFNYVSNLKLLENDRAYDLIIDAKYSPETFNKIYGQNNALSFKDVYAEILYDETLKFLNKNNIEYYFFEGPVTSKIKNLDEFEKSMLKIRNFGVSPYKIRKNIVNKIYRKNKSKNFILSREFIKVNKLINNGKFLVMVDHKSNFYNLKDGIRYTHGNPSKYQNSVYTFGPCIVKGTYVSDEYTIASELQKNINSKTKEKIRIVNCGTSGINQINDFEYILNTEFKPGDIVININTSNEILDKALKKYKSHYLDTSHLFNRPHKHGYWMLDSSGFHMNHIGNKVIADYIYDTIRPKLNRNTPKKKQNTVKYKFENDIDTFVDNNPDFKKYLNNLKNINIKNNIKGKIGSIVMNCNPFTLGHRYLIEQALKYTDHLYIFVVEEDKSVFPFKDRINLVKKGTEDLGDRITVLPSGKWIISLTTFPEYFDKDELQTASIDPSKDINLFGKYIAPTLGISKRFVGEEPFDKVTKQYNDSMKKLLPKFGIEFHEIPRKSVGSEDDIISATKVRKALKEKDFTVLKRYVPQTTFDYLEKNYEEISKKL